MIMLRLIISMHVILFSMPYLSFAEMSSTNFSISTSVMDSAGLSKSSPNFLLLDSIGQPTAIGFSTTSNFSLEAGFLYTVEFSMALDKTTSNTVNALGEILIDPSFTQQERKKIGVAINFLEDALAAWTLYEAGDPTALANALNKTKSAINKLIDSGVTETVIYQKMLSQASELAVTSEINRIASVVGDNNPNIVQARIFLSNGSLEILNTIYDSAVQSFTQAYNEAIQAV